MRGGARRAFPLIALLAGSLLFGVLLAEGLLRFVRYSQPQRRWYVGERANRESPNFVADSLTGWRMRPHHRFEWILGGERTSYQSNAQGMRDPENFGASCAKPRLVLIGDSFVFGSGVEYPQTVGARLEDSLGGGWDVYSLAMPGFGMDQMWMSLRHQAPALCPALLAVIFIDEDWDRSLTAFRAAEGMNKPTFILESDTLRPAGPADRAGPVARFVQRHSRVLEQIHRLQKRAAYRHGHGEWWSLNAAILDAMARDASGRPMVLVRVARKGAQRPFPALADYLHRTERNYLDLGDSAAGRTDIYLERDDHLGPLGHAWLAGRLLDWMRVAQPALLPSVRPARQP